MFLAIHPHRRVAAFEEVVIDLGDTAGAWFADPPFVRHEVRHGHLCSLIRYFNFFLHVVFADSTFDI